MRGERMREAIERRIQELLADADSRFEWVKPAVRKHGFLPLYLGWVAVIGVRPDGSFVRWDHEDAPEVVKPLADPYWERMALCQGAKKYPELASLIPERPPEARSCEPCKGTGQLEGTPRLAVELGTEVDEPPLLAAMTPLRTRHETHVLIDYSW